MLLFQVLIIVLAPVNIKVIDPWRRLIYTWIILYADIIQNIYEYIHVIHDKYFYVLNRLRTHILLIC